MKESIHKVILGLGSNIGDREKNINTAIDMLREKLDIEKISTVIETEPYGYKDQPMFLNCCLIARTYLLPEELLNFILSIENRMGRIREFKWGPRNIDIDILFYDDLVIEDDNLLIPHPELHRREFVLIPLIEISPNLIHPKLKKTIKEIYDDLKKAD